MSQMANINPEKVGNKMLREHEQIKKFSLTNFFLYYLFFHVFIFQNIDGIPWILADFDVRLEASFCQVCF